MDIPQIAAKAREVIDKEQGQQYHYWQYEQKTLETSKGLRLSEARLYRWRQFQLHTLFFVESTFLYNIILSFKKLIIIFFNLNRLFLFDKNEGLNTTLKD